MHFTQLANPLSRDFQACALSDARFRNYLASSRSLCGAPFPGQAVENYSRGVEDTYRLTIRLNIFSRRGFDIVFYARIKND